MASLCFHVVFLLCVINHSCQENSGDVDICSDTNTSGNAVRLSLTKKTEPERVCECTALVDKPYCMKMDFETISLQSGCDYFQESEYAGIDPNCTIQSVENDTCPQEINLRFRGERLEGYIMTISGYRKDVNLNVTCRMLHRSALRWTKHCNVSHNILKNKKTALICSQRTSANQPAPSEDLVCPTGITVTNVYVGVKGGTFGDCGHGTRSSGNKDYCCQQEETEDILFNAHCLEQLQDMNEQKQYQRFLDSVYDCDNETTCKVNDTILPLGPTVQLKRKSSSYFIVEYECTGQETATTATATATATTPDQSTHGNKTKVEMKAEPEDKLLTYVIAGVVVGVSLVIAIVTVLFCIRKRRSSADKHVYMTIERTAGQELQNVTGRSGQNREDGFEDIPLESDNELDPLYDQADQQDQHSGVHTCKSDGNNSDHTNNGTHGSALATAAISRRDEDDTYDHTGNSCKKKTNVQARLTMPSDEGTYDHTGGPVGAPTGDRAGGRSGGPQNMVEGGVYGKLNHDDDVYDHATRQSLKSPSNKDSASSTYGRLNMNPEDGDVYNHTGDGEKKVKVIDEEYTTLNP